MSIVETNLAIESKFKLKPLSSLEITSIRTFELLFILKCQIAFLDDLSLLTKCSSKATRLNELKFRMHLFETLRKRFVVKCLWVTIQKFLNERPFCCHLLKYSMLQNF